ncbi:uncharacterized protein LOC115675496 isoform X1 [Syzygium oleosum]|uniref:uncharacterized protein LOC115675496 isoform X1 n=1 Tax=Syzygium oleosum TaxID=219896 RepID=UPI0011D1A6F8|nr:uncharacterized protein LOC115675496 isoform X1 [Syzygium oleosum]
MAGSSTAAAATAPSAAAIRSWRTGFLTLRDETLTSPPRTSLADLLHSLIFSNSSALVAAAPNLPPQEVSSDVLFLIELVSNADLVHGNGSSFYTHLCHLVHDVTRRVSLDINSSSWMRILNSFDKSMEVLMGGEGMKGGQFANAARIRPIMDCLETLRCLIGAFHRKSSLSENMELVKFLCHNVACTRMKLLSSSYRSVNKIHAAFAEKRTPRFSSLWEVQTLAFTMLGEAFSRAGSLFPSDIWQLVIEVIRKEMDSLASMNLIVEDNVMSKFYASLLQCLHLVLVEPKCSLSEHVPGFVVALRGFFTYGLTSSRLQHDLPIVSWGEKEVSSGSSGSRLGQQQKADHKPYRPPHLRKKDSSCSKHIKKLDSQSSSDHESSTVEFMSSDSDYSDSDTLGRESNATQSSKVRIAAIRCVQDLCQADHKSFTAQWTMILPTSDALESRKFDPTLMTCLLFDPYLKVRIAAATTLAVLLDGPSSAFMQIAEYRDPSKLGSFTSLSSSLGEILMQLHRGIIHLIMRETHSGLLGSLFKILMLLISSTPYMRMRRELLPTVIESLQARIEEDFSSKMDQTSLLAATISCLTAALSTSSPSVPVQEMLTGEISQGFSKTPKKLGVLSTLFKHSEPPMNLTTRFEALQGIRAVSHNYPSIMLGCWQQVFSVVYVNLGVGEFPRSVCRGQSGNICGVLGEKVIAAAVKVLDECLRAISGFRGTEDLCDDRLIDSPFASESVRMKKISSAPSYIIESPDNSRGNSEASHTGSEQWCEAIEKYLPLTLRHSSSLVRTASVTSFAGITSSAFNSLPKHKQEFILSSTIYAALEDAVPSVRSAACRAIGVIACFPEVSQSAEIVDKLIHAVEVNTHDSIVSVRVTACWALANICDSFRHCFGDKHQMELLELEKCDQRLAFLVECALRLTKDGDKVKSNAVRALGSLSRFVTRTSLPGAHERLAECASSSKTSSSEGHPSTVYLQIIQRRLSSVASCGGSDMLGRMVQAFLSCVTTGNVKVQWNVCHALSNLFRNETMQLRDEDWAPSVFSILLLLLRDSSNFKIRIQAAAALAVPASKCYYGRSFSDVVQGLEHVLENLGSDQVANPSNFKYRVALEKQLTSSMLHVISLVWSTDHQPLKDFLVKKSAFLEEWLKALCSSLKETSTHSEVEDISVENQKKEIISKALRSLVEVYESGNHHTTAEKFKVLHEMIR